MSTKSEEINIYENVHFLAQRNDGFSERLRVILNSIAFSKYYSTNFKFYWKQFTSNVRDAHEVRTKEETFSDEFIKKSCVF